MRRREFITLIGGAAVGMPCAARAQQSPMPVVGFLNSASAASYARMVTAFRQGLGDAGFIEGQNIVIEYHWADGQYHRLPALAADLVRRQIAVIFANTPAVQAVMATATTIPIVFSVSSDPVKDGLVASLSRPGANVTGVTQTNVEVTPKRLELLHELLPASSVLALLVNPTGPTLAEPTSTNMQAASRTLGVHLEVLHASTESDFADVFATLARLRAGGLVIGSDPFFTSRSEQLAALSVSHMMPAVYQYREFTAAGGLMSYGGSLTDSYRLAGVYAARILKGEKPADLPVQQSTKVDFIINLKTAKALGITVPLPLAARADEVIE